MPADETRDRTPRAGAGAEPPDLPRRGRDAAARREELLEAVARDLHLPIARLAAEVRLALAASPPPPARASLEEMARHLERLTDLEHDLGELLELSLGRVEPRRVRVDLAALCARVADAVEPRARERGAALVRELPAFPVTARADEERLARAFHQVAAAVAAAAGPGAAVAIRLDPLPGGARLLVELRGPPVSGDAPAAAAIGAVSLALCREVVELAGGALEAGTARAELFLPAEGAAAEPLPTPVPSPAGGGRPRILVVEDDEGTREALAEALADRYDVEPATDGLAGVEAARERRPDVILMDLYLPGLDGFAALEALRVDAATADVPVILVSGVGDDLTRARSLDLGAVDFLQKPFSERELRARIERTLRLARRQTQLQALAETDALTGLANRLAFRGRLAQEVKRAQRYGTPLSCVMIDLDHLKPVNDELGHAAGDRAIVALAGVLRSELRETDFAARFGGDEFVLLLPHTSASEGRALAARICDRVRETTFDAGGAPRPISASFGVAELPAGAAEDAGEALVRDADAALYEAKHGGRGRVAVRAGPGLPPVDR
jgi:diguanylate cyclase (GGDEF)-like protein